MKCVPIVAAVLLFACITACTASPSNDRKLMELLTKLDKELKNRARAEGAAGLQMSASTQNVVEGTFATTSKDGIVFMCKDHENGNGKMVISNKAGETILYALKEGGLVLATVAGKNMLYHDKDGKQQVFVVPNNHMAVLENAVEDSNSVIVERLKENLEELDASEGKAHLEKLLTIPEANLIVEAAKTLGESGLAESSSNAGARVFFAFARNLQRRMRTTTAINNNYYATQEGTEQCTTFDTTCPAGRCPFNGPGNDCFGMCGLGCNCWSFLCGDCCTHQGCIDHDSCCAENGFFSSRCFFPFDFSCDSPFNC